MKKVLVLLLVFIFTLTGCNYNENHNAKGKKISTGLWISYSEIDAMINSNNGFEEELENVVANCEKLAIGNVYLHIRSHGEVLYKSDYFPQKNNVKESGIDILKLFINSFKEKGIRIHLWINPYRISATSTKWDEILAQDSIIRKWLSDQDSENDKNVCLYNGIYLNPARAEVRKIIIDSIREVLNKYSVDGIHFDDYFYPTTDSLFDSSSYKDYCDKTQNPMSLAQWRRENINSLISGCYSAIKYINKDIIFSISPAASVEKNYNEYYADIAHWVEIGNVDYIIPQLYFGFEYPENEYKFSNLLKKWEKLISNKNVGLLIGLGSYKIGTEASPDNKEWSRDDDIIARQAEACYKSEKAEGYVLFSYNSVFSQQDLNKKQTENLYLKQKEFK